MEVRLGKIEKATLGKGGYDDAMFGLSITLMMGSTGVGDFIGTWMVRPSRAEYSEQEWDAEHAKCYKRIREIMGQAKCFDIAKLAGTPVEVTLDGSRLKSWRVLEEVL